MVKNEIELANAIVNIINSSRENAFKKVNEELIENLIKQQEKNI